MKNSNKGLLFVIITSLTFVGLLLLSFLAGYRFLFVEAPSMGTTAPVGSLIISKPQGEYKKGDIVSYYNSAGRIYTHRIVSAAKDGNYITKGDLNATNDSLTLPKNNIIGSAIYIGKYVGWIWRALPILVIGMIIAYLISISKRVKDDWRGPVRIIGYCISVIVATFILNPWIRVQLHGGYMPVDGGVEMSIVNTGIFPIRDENGGRFFAGEVRKIKVTEVDDEGRFIYVPRPSLGFLGVVLLLLWCLLPLIFAMTVKLPLTEEQELLEEEEFEKEKRTSGVIFAIVLVVSIIFLVTQLSTLAAFVASVRNSANTVRTGFFTCSEAQRLTAGAMGSVFVHGLGTAGAANESNLNKLNANKLTTVNSAGACVRDTQRDALVFNGTDTCLVRNVIGTPPNSFTLEAWFKTSSRTKGPIISFGNNDYTIKRQIDTKNDRHIYMVDGRVKFGLYPSASIGTRVVASPAGVNYADDRWHHVVATLSETEGMKLYLDGTLVGSNANTKQGEASYQGYWKIGCGKTAGWDGGDNKPVFNGALRNVAVYSRALTPFQVRELYLAGK